MSFAPTDLLVMYRQPSSHLRKGMNARRRPFTVGLGVRASLRRCRCGKRDTGWDGGSRGGVLHSRPGQRRRRSGSGDARVLVATVSNDVYRQQRGVRRRGGGGGENARARSVEEGDAFSPLPRRASVLRIFIGFCFVFISLYTETAAAPPSHRTVRTAPHRGTLLEGFSPRGSRACRGDTRPYVALPIYLPH